MTFAHLLNRFRDAVASDGKPETQPAKMPPERPKTTRGVARPAPDAWLQTTHQPKAEPDLQMRKRIRDRYLAVRFPGAPHTDEELRDSASVIKSARLDPEDPVFRLARPHESAIDEHYGAWPQVQNWIQAPFDLTGDVLAAEFHAKMRGGGDVSPTTRWCAPPTRPSAPAGTS